MPKQPFTYDNNRVNYTLQGSQPYVLSGQWPSYFIPNGMEMKIDNSMSNIMGFNVQDQQQFAIYKPFYDKKNPK